MERADFTLQTVFAITLAGSIACTIATGQWATGIAKAGRRKILMTAAIRVLIVAHFAMFIGGALCLIFGWGGDPLAHVVLMTCGTVCGFVLQEHYPFSGTSRDVLLPPAVRRGKSRPVPRSSV